MKKLIVSLLIFSCVFCLFGCRKRNQINITPNPKAVDKISFQRTNIDENNEYTYFEKSIDEAGQIAKFCSKLDRLAFETKEPTEFTSVDYLIVFEGANRHKLLVSKNDVIYDGIAYECKNKDLISYISKLYRNANSEEVKTESKLFK